jgi:predicted phosphodiesterase
MKISYLSDLHLDFHLDGGISFLNSLEIPETDLLVIAGDFMDVSITAIVAPLRFFCERFKNVLWVTGNHEYYHSDILNFNFNSCNFSKFKNLKVIEKATVLDYDGLQILAGTMWFPDKPDHYLHKRFLSDYQYIKSIEPEIYKRNKEFDIQLHGIKDEECVVVSHHLPSNMLINPKYRHSELNRFFVGGEFFDLIFDSKIKAWIFGHSHLPVDTTINHTIMTSNPFGYPHEGSRNFQIKTIEV